MDLLSIAEIRSLIADGAWLVDARPSAIFIQGFIPGSLHIPPSDSFGEYAAFLIEPEMKLVLLAESGQENTIARKLAATGFANLKGIASGGYQAWIDAGGAKDLIIDISPDEFELDFNYDEFYLIDLRDPDKYEEEHIQYAENLPLTDLEDAIPDLNQDEIYYLYGDSLEDAALAASLFKRAGFHKLHMVNEGFEALKNTDLPIVKKKKTNTDANFSAN